MRLNDRLGACNPTARPEDAGLPPARRARGVHDIKGIQKGALRLLLRDGGEGQVGRHGRYQGVQYRPVRGGNNHGPVHPSGREEGNGGVGVDAGEGRGGRRALEEVVSVVLVVFVAVSVDVSRPAFPVRIDHHDRAGRIRVREDDVDLPPPRGPGVEGYEGDAEIRARQESRRLPRGRVR